jgi:hypothetical protein
MRNERRLTVVAVGAATAVLAINGIAWAATAQVVTPDAVGATDHWHTADTRPPGTMAFTTQYGGANGSAGAVLFSTPDSSAKEQLFTDEYDRLRLADITALSYSTYRVSHAAGDVAVTALNMRVDLGGASDVTTDGQHDPDVDAYLVYEPYRTAGNLVQDRVWQTWDAWSPEAMWWSGQISGACDPDNPCTIDTLLAKFPDATVREDTVSKRSGSTPADADFQGALGFNQGSGNPELVAAADGLHLASAARGIDITYDFEVTKPADPAPPEVTLTSKDDCKKGEWESSTKPVFRNQGDCVSHFATSGSSPKTATSTGPATVTIGLARNPVVLKKMV